MIPTDLVEVPNFIPGDHVIRCKSDRMAPDVRAGDWLVLHKQDTAKPGQLVFIDTGDGVASLEKFETGMRVIGLVTGLMRRLDVD